MSFPKLVENKNDLKINPDKTCKNLYKGACVKIKNSQKTFQIVGINPESKVCWIREWPFDLQVNKTFSLDINQIILQTFCSESFNEK